MFQSRFNETNGWLIDSDPDVKPLRTRLDALRRRLTGVGKDLTVGTVASLLAAVIIALAVGVWAVLRDDDKVGSDRVQGQGSASAPSVAPGGETAGWFDAGGHRQPIVFRDQLTPWKDQPSFNCLVETPSYGDERAFFDARHADEVRAGAYGTVLDVNPGDRLILRIYVHNCADPAVNTASPPRGDSVDTRVRVVAPTDPARHVQAYALVIAANAQPAWVADGLDLHSSVPILLRFTPGSAVLYGSNFSGPHHIVDDGFVTSRTIGPAGPASTIGSSKIDGVVAAEGFRSQLVVEVAAEVIDGR